MMPLLLLPNLISFRTRCKSRLVEGGHSVNWHDRLSMKSVRCQSFINVWGSKSRSSPQSESLEAPIAMPSAVPQMLLQSL